MFQRTEQRNLGTLTPSRSIAFKRLSWMLLSLRTRTHSVFREISLTASGFPLLANRRCELKRRAFRWARLTSLHRLPPRSSGHSTIPCPSPPLGSLERVEEPLRRLGLSLTSESRTATRIALGSRALVWMRRTCGRSVTALIASRGLILEMWPVSCSWPARNLPKLRIIEMQMRTMAEPLVWPLKAHSL
jgi:hypothetical protein